ncbi:ferrous iron transport protein B [bacterium]|nr:ferrous iron transport protein B [bacterium]
MSAKKFINIAIAGQPNVGKSTIFNFLTGIRQHVGNYPGVTVDRKEGEVSYGDYHLKIHDLPGTYSMSAFSPEEIVARDVIVNEKPDLVINVVDASNLEKNLYLTLQLLEMRVPVVLFLNMMDIAEKNGMKISKSAISNELGIPVVSGIGSKKEGLTELLTTAIAVYEKKRQYPGITYSDKMESFIEDIKLVLAQHSVEMTQGWIAVKLLEKDNQIEQYFDDGFLTHIKSHIKELEREIRKEYGADSVAAVIKERYNLIEDISKKAIKRSGEVRSSFSRKVDAIVLHEHLSLPLFFLLMFVLFQMVFTLGDPMMGGLETLFGWIGDAVSGLWPDGSDSLLRSLIVDGIIGGVGGVLLFAPNIFLMFFGIAFLEGSGYMARVAVIMDKYMARLGLSGKSFVPMILGFGCSVPAIMGARIIENKWERLTTILIIPFMSCGARLPVYLLLVSIFIPAEYQALSLWGIYMFGVMVGLIVAKLLRKTVLKGDENPLLMELPGYAMPTVRTLAIYTWDRGKHFLEKAGTIILAVSIILWVMTVFPRYEAPAGSNMSNQQIVKMQVENSFIGKVGKFVEPAVALMGGDWKVGSAFVASLAAKEVFVSQLGILFSLGSDVDEDNNSLQAKIKQRYSLPAALAFILFILLSAPCIATFAIVKSETRSWRWPIFQFFGMTLIAFGVAVFAYQIGRLFL